MGVPKFYRWISERYPCLSEVIKEYQVPEFDNLYLDMNGIIHVCSHPNDDDPHFRISEEQIFADIFHYIDFLFKIIKPKKVFFMAVDGVAPRAKMNQQRGRRFRTARDSEILEQKAKENGEILPDQARFDSNCITPGTQFMARLHEKLKSFVCYKMSTDILWQPTRVYLSGHETPGEGEHKIMDFIRHEKSQPAYDPNTRHCLYGLDADLIMLGLSSHEPHFSLLREEVRFGSRKNQKRVTSPEETTFHLLHLSLMREYIGYEFSPVKGKLPFDFDLENIIDDFVLMSFLVGNDFIPHLPQLHIHHDALPVLYKNYMDVLPILGGYINEGGFLNLERFEIFLSKLAEFDYNKFSAGNPDFRIFEKKSSSSKNHELPHSSHTCILDILGESELDEGMTNLNVGFSILNEAPKDISEEEEDEEEESLLSIEFTEHKKDYYCTKLEYENVTPEVLKEQAEGYVRAIQWNLHYYYNGVVSWSWYYPHHYSPYISDVKNFKNMKMEFEMEKPFLPFQQLIAVLPAASKALLPKAYQDLMCNPDSPLIDCYPADFQTDLNGKQQEWEAIVLIPFINENLLLKYTAEADKTLNSEEKQRNRHGPHLLYKYSEQSLGKCESCLPGYFPEISSNHAKCIEINQDAFRLPTELIKKGLCDGVQLETFFPGFPTLKHIPHTAELRHAKVRVFQNTSYKENMILTLTEGVKQNVEEVVDDLLGKNIYVNWPHLQEACVMSVSDGNVSFKSTEDETGALKLEKKDLTPNERVIFEKQGGNIQEHYFQRFGVDIGDINFLVYANTFMGSKLVCMADGSIQEEKQWSKLPVCYVLQATVKDIAVHCPQFKEKKSLKDVFSIGSPVFMLGNPYYGSMGEVVDNDSKSYKGRIIVKFRIPAEPNLWPVIKNKRNLSSLHYVPGYILAQQLGLKSMFVSRLTGTFLIQTNSKESISPNRVNVGLNLKFNAKNEEVDGFSKKGEDGKWLYSDHVLKILGEYVAQFPDFIEKLNSFMKEDVVYLEDLYPDGSGQEIVREISKWLKSQECSSAERHACGITQLDEGVVRGLEEAVNDTQVKDNILYKEIEVKPQMLYSPFFCKGCAVPDPGTKFHLFDRVVNVRPTLSVPLGLRGTVVGIRPAEKECDYVFEVLFDEEFFGALSLKSSSKQGYRMLPSYLINISHGERQSQASNSPVRSLKNWRQSNSGMDKESEAFQINYRPKGNRNALVSTNFGGQSKQVSVKNTDGLVDCPVTILKKSLQEQYSAQHNQPFYKTDFKNYKQELGHSPNSGFSSLKYAANVGMQFVTPKANSSAVSAGKGNPAPPSLSKLPSSCDVKFEDTWNNLLKRTKSEQHTDKQSSVQDSLSHSKYQVSVEELFHHAKHSRNSQNRNNSSTFSLPVQPSLKQSPLSYSGTHQSSFAGKLMDHCLSCCNEPPSYTYSSSFNGSNTNIFATVHLPSGQKFVSDPCHNVFQATESVAVKALQYLNPHFSSMIRYPVQSQPTSYVQFNEQFGRNFASSGLLRHPPPPSSLHIPHSFIDENKKYMAGRTGLPYRFPHVNTQVTFVADPVQDTTFSYREIKKSHSAMKDPSVSKQNSVFEKNTFIPLQVSMNQTKKSKDNTNQEKISEDEWPMLPCSDQNCNKTTPDLFTGVWQQKDKSQMDENTGSSSSSNIGSPPQAKACEDKHSSSSQKVFVLTSLSSNPHPAKKSQKGKSQMDENTESCSSHNIGSPPQTKDAEVKHCSSSQKVSVLTSLSSNPHLAKKSKRTTKRRIAANFSNA